MKRRHVAPFLVLRFISQRKPVVCGAMGEIKQYRKSFYWLVATLCFLFSCLLQAETVASKPESKPNIVMIIADDLTWNDYGFMGHPAVQTPNIDRLAEEGVLFTNGYLPNSICRPSLASLATGLYPYQHKITTNYRKINTRRLEDETDLPVYVQQMQTLDTIPRFLAQHGYASYQAGKWWEEAYSNGGFTHGDKAPDKEGFALTRKNIIGRETMEPLYDFIKEHKESPFFIWYAPQLPHTPLNPAKQYKALYSAEEVNEKTKKYWGMITWFDETVGELVSFVAQQGLSENTLFIYLADNGYLMNPDIMGRSMTQGKLTPYDGGGRTPVIFYWPDTLKGETRSELVSSLDMFPTLVELVSGSGDHDIEFSGLSLLPLLETGKDLQRDYVAGEGFRNAGDRDLLNNPREYRWLRKGEWKLIEFSHGARELYNMSLDPAELNNLIDAAAHQSTVQHLAGLLEEELPSQVSQPSQSLQ